MCGFLGIASNSNIPSNFDKAFSSISYRGPDSKNIININEDKYKIILGHHRLEILDIEKGSQPMISRDGNYIISYNGEIYNFKELKKNLEQLGYKFLSDYSDTEVILIGYIAWGEKIVEKLNGMWSFAIIDKRKEKIFLSRDRVGEKPLFYFLNNEFFLFSSESHSLIEIVGDKINLDYLNIAKYNCLGFFPNDKTPYKEIMQLPAGNNLSYDLKEKKIVLNKYWEYSITPDYTKNEKYWTNQIYDLVEDSVKKRLVADTDVGVYLSGGLDSSIITHFASKYHPKKLKSFSINFGEEDFDESKFSNYISNKFNTEHFSTKLETSEIDNLIKEFFQKSNELISDSSLLSYYELCKFTKPFLKVILGGDGSDELFGGYDTFKAIKYAKFVDKYKINKSYSFLNKLLNFFPTNYNNMNFKFKLNRFMKYNNNKISTANPLWISPLTLDETNQILDKNYKLEEIYTEIIDEWNNCKAESNVDKSLVFYFKFFLQNQMMVKIDRISMLNSIEVRSPFLDYNLIDLVSKIPSDLKINGNQTKYILKKSFENVFPKNFIFRRKKGLSTPLSKFILENKNKLNLNSKILKNKNSFFSQQIESHCNFKSENRLIIWNMLNLDNYFKKKGL